jgi:hypothetical protein
MATPRLGIATSGRAGCEDSTVVVAAERTEAPAAVAGPRDGGGGNVLARAGARTAAHAKAGALFSLANGALLGRRRSGQAQRSILPRIVAVMARSPATKRGRLWETPL